MITIKDNVKNTLKLEVASHNRVSEMRINLQKIQFLDKIHLHKHIGEVIYTDLLKDTLKVSKLQATVGRLENQMNKEKIENKTYQQQIKKLQYDLWAMDNEPNRGQATKKSLVQ